MTTDEIRTFIERYVDAWEREDVSTLMNCYANNARIESPMFHTILGRADIETSFKDVFRAFDEWKFKMEDLIIDRGVEDRAVLVFTSEVTHRGDLFGMPGTGRRVENSGAFIIRLENGRIVSERRLYDFTGLLVQLGVLKARAV